ncbi:MAG: tetratricopeptide repeat protein [Planctomycetota bacterium]|nr:tetratricopeptide repeat protein [Planctomycetota bacterium]
MLKADDCFRASRGGGLGVSAALALIIVSGCATERGGSPRGEGGQRSSLSGAAREERDERALRAGPPAGVPADIDQVLSGEALQKASKPLAEVLGSWGPVPDGPAAPAAMPATADDRLEAVRAYTLGRVQLLAGDAERAEASLTEAARRDPSSAAIWRELGEASMAQGNRTSAVSAFRRALALNPTDIRALEVLSRTAVERREFESAVAYLKPLRELPAGQLDPALPYLVNARLGRALSELGYASAGAEATRAAIDLPELFGQTTLLQTELAQLYRARGDLLRDMGDAALHRGSPEEAAGLYERAAALPTLNPSGLMARRVYAQMKLGDPLAGARIVLEDVAATRGRVDQRTLDLLRYIATNSSAGPRVERLLEEIRAGLKPEDLAASRSGLARAQAAASAAEPARSMSILRAHLATSPADDAALADLFALARQNGRAGLLDQTLALVAEAPVHEGRYARAMLQTDRDPAALLGLLDGAGPGVGGGDGDGGGGGGDETARRLLRARLLAVLGKFDESERELALLLEERPAFAPALAARVSALTKLGRFEEAADIARGLDTSIDPALVGAKVVALTEAGRSDEALDVLMPALPAPEAATAADADVFMQAARLALSLGRFEEACDWLTLTTRLDPTRDEAYTGLVNLFGPAGPLASEERLFETIRVLRDAHPSSPTLRWLRAQEALARGQLDMAERDLRDLAEDVPERGGVVEALVRLWRSQSRLDEAERWLRAQLARRPELSVFTTELGSLLAQRNRRDEALDLLEKRLADQPGDDDVSRVLERVLRETMGGSARADELTRARLARSPRTPEALVEAAEFAAAQRDLGEAAVTVERLFAGVRRLPADLVVRLTRLGVDSAEAALRGEVPLEAAAALQSAVLRGVPASPAGVHTLHLRLLARAGAPPDAIIEAVERAAGQTGGSPRRVEFYALAFDALAGGGQQQGLPGGQRVGDGLVVLEHACRTIAPPPPSMHAVWTLHVWLIAGYQSGETLARSIELARDSNTLDTLVTELGKLLSNNGRAVDPADLAAEMANALNGAAQSEELIEYLYRAALRYNPLHLWANNNLGYQLVSKGRAVREGYEMIQRAYREMPRPTASITDSMGWARFRVGVIRDEVGADGRVVREGAVTLLQRAYDLVKLEARDARLQRGLALATPIIAGHLADALWAAGEKERALLLWQETVDSGLGAMQVQAGGASVSPEAQEAIEAAQAAQRKLDAAARGEEPELPTIFREEDPGPPAAEGAAARVEEDGALPRGAVEDGAGPDAPVEGDPADIMPR